MTTKTDPLLMEVLKNALIAITEEMSVTLYRSAYSTNIKTRKDYSCALFDNQLRLIAQAFAQPAHLGIVSRAIPIVINRYGADNLGPGDTLIVNDPYCGCCHLNDVALITPVFDEVGQKLAYLANMAHHVDVGGSAPSSLPLSQEIYQEGIIIPPVKIVCNGSINRDVYDFLLRNVRAKHETTGDFKAQIAANGTGAERFGELLKRYDMATLGRYIEALLDYTERRTQQAFGELPPGEYFGEDWMDDDGFTDEPIKIKVKLKVDADGVHCDFTGTDPQRRSPVNCTLSFVHSAVSYAMKCLVGEDIPVNDGFYRCIKIFAPEGSTINAREPAGVVGGFELGSRVVNTVFKALSTFVPQRIMAACKGHICNIGFGGFDPRHQKYFAYMETIGGGFGGRKGKDGIDGVNTDFSNTENAPVEEMEIGYPVLIDRYELIPDSCGSGQWRGGLGIRRDFKFPYGPVTFCIISDRSKYPPWGIEGGQAATPSKYIYNPGRADQRNLPSKGTVEINQGDVVRVETAGGGGYGDPELRAPDAVRRDVALGKLTSAKAADDYGCDLEAIPTT